MCGLFINADESLWVSSTRSLRIDGMVTSIRLEQYFWLILEEVAERDGMSVGQLITKLYLEAIDAHHDIGNFTSFLRVCCTRYLALIADGYLVRDARRPLADIPSDSILAQEKEHLAQRQRALKIRSSDLAKAKLN